MGYHHAACLILATECVFSSTHLFDWKNGQVYDESVCVCSVFLRYAVVDVEEGLVLENLIVLTF